MKISASARGFLLRIAIKNAVKKDAATGDGDGKTLLSGGLTTDLKTILRPPPLLF